MVKNSFNFVTTQFTVFNHTETEYEIYSASLEPRQNTKDKIAESYKFLAMGYR